MTLFTWFTLPTQFIMAGKQKKVKVKGWQFSDARLTLCRDMIAGVVTVDSDPEVVHGMYDIYKPYKVEKFPPYMESMQKQLDRDRTYMAWDVQAYGHNVGLVVELLGD